MGQDYDNPLDALRAAAEACPVDDDTKAKVYYTRLKEAEARVAELEAEFEKWKSVALSAEKRLKARVAELERALEFIDRTYGADRPQGAGGQAESPAHQIRDRARAALKGEPASEPSDASKYGRQHLSEMLISVRAELDAQLAASEARVAELEAAVAPVLHFLACWEAKPLGGAGDEFYSIHVGTEWGATLSLEQFRAIRAALTPTKEETDA